MERECYLYVVAKKNRDGFAEPCKVGITFNPTQRLVSIQTGSPVKLGIAHLFVLPGSSAARYAERMILQIEAKNKLYGEWLRTPPDELAEKISLNLLALFIGMGLSGEALDLAMRDCCAMPKDGDVFKLNHGVIV